MHYNLDVAISVGYRVRSKQGTAFRQWATALLKEHLIQGYTLYKPRLAQRGLHELKQTIELLQKTLKQHHLVKDIGSEVIQLILSYAKTWNLLLAYDEDKLELPEIGHQIISHLDHKTATKAVLSLKEDLSGRNEASQFFGVERDAGLEGILNTIEQTFDEEPL